MKKRMKVLALILAMALVAGVLGACSSAPASSAGTTASGEAGKPDTSKEVKLIYYVWGTEGVANPDILAEINKLMKEDINATMEVKYIDWGDTATKYPLLFTSGEQFDFTEASPSFPVSYYTIAKQDAVMDISSMLDSVPTLRDEVPQKNWDYTKVGGKIFGVPTLYVAFNSYGLITRADLQEKYKIDTVDSIETAEQYFDAALADGLTPLNGNALLSAQLYRMFLNTTGEWWPEVPGVTSGELTLAAKSLTDYKEIFHPAYTEEFMQWATKMREWADKGYWGKDVLAAPKSDKDNFIEGASASYIAHQPDWTGSYGTLKEKLPDATTNFWCFGEKNGKIKRMAPTENLAVVSSTSKNPERALMAIEKLMTDERYYRLFQFGIEGREYELIDGVVQTPAGYNIEKDAGGFAAWSLRNNRLNLPLWSEDPRRAPLNTEWDKIAKDDPYIGFAFDPKPVSTELAAVTNVNATLGNQIMVGKTPNSAAEAVEEYRTQLTNAGIDKIIAEVKTQLDAFEASK